MQRLAIRLALVLVVLLIASQFAIPPYVEHRVAGRLTEHGGHASVHLSAFPALGLLLGSGGKLTITARGLSVDLTPGQDEVFKRLDDFSRVNIAISQSRAGPFAIGNFDVLRIGDHAYRVRMAGNGTAGDVARYAGAQLAGGFGQALAGLAASALGGFDRPLPFDAMMRIDTSAGHPIASDVVGSVDGVPAGPLAQVVANALLGNL